MASFSDFGITAGSPAQVNVNTYDLHGKVIDDGDQHTIADYTGNNSLRWPDCLATLTDDQRQVILSDMGVAQQIMKWKAGVQ